MVSIKAVSFGMPKASLSRAARRSSQTDAKRRSGRARRIAAAALGVAVLVLVGASAASASTAYISNASTNFVTPINLTTNTVETGINVKAPTSSIAITPNGKLAFAPAFEGETVIPVNLESKEPETPITLGKKIEPEAVAVTPNGEYAWVAEEEANNVKVVKVATNEVVETITVGEEPEGIAFVGTKGEVAYVANKATEHQGTVTVIEKANTENPKSVKTINIGKAGTKTEPCLNESKNPVGFCVEPEKIAISPNGKFAYVADGAAGTVTVIEKASEPTKAEVVETITVGGAEVGGTEPSNIAITPDGNTAYVTNGTANTVVPIEINNSNKVGTAIAVGSEPHGLAITPDGTLVVVTDEEQKEKEDVRVIEKASKPKEAKVKEKFNVAGIPDGVAIH